MLMRILLTISLLSFFNMLLPSISCADSKDVRKSVFVLIALIGFECAKSGEKYYTDVNSRMTKDDFIRDYEQIDDVLKSCMRKSVRLFYSNNDNEVNVYVDRAFEDNTLMLQVRGVASCSFFGGYSFLQKNSGKKMSPYDKEKLVKTCMDFKLK